MAKVPGDRYQTVPELVEDLTIASGMSIFGVAPAGVRSVSKDDADEVTVVRTREEPLAVPRRAPVTVPVQPVAPQAPVASSFNPWTVLIPAAVALLVVFGAIYTFTRNSPASSPNTNEQVTPTLAADPNSQPVQPTQPATGKAEEGLPAGGTIKPSANVNASPNANAEGSPQAIEDLSPAANTNENANINSNSNRKAPALPEPTRSVVPETAPPLPSPSATKPPAEKPSPTATPA
jgi:hypothetical protein